MVIFLVPISSVASAASKPISEPVQVTVKVGDIINGEEVFWVSQDTKLDQDDIAYVTVTMEERAIPSPLGNPVYFRMISVIARTQLGIKQFWELTAGIFSFNGGSCGDIIDYCFYGTFKPWIWQKVRLDVTPTLGYEASLLGEAYFQRNNGDEGWAWTSITITSNGHTDYDYAWYPGYP